MIQAWSMTPRVPPVSGRPVALAVLVASLGYFVDIYDLILFAIVRLPSLQGLGISDPGELLSVGASLMQWQMGGMLVGGVLWGVLGDRRGRLSVLFGSILLYSLANIANGVVVSVAQYAALRFVAGIGLAGELGAGVPLVGETMDKRSRGWGTTIIAAVGILGAVVASLVGGKLPWRTAYFIGGGMGIALLILRIGVFESGMFQKVRDQGARLGHFWMLFWPLKRARRYISVVLIGIPVWYAVGILIAFCPEIGKALHMAEVPKPASAVLWMYLGLAAGDLASGALSQILQTRKKVVGAFVLLNIVSVAGYFLLGRWSSTWFYAAVFFLGVTNGYWAVFVTMASEQFGTNLRATATTSAPNFVRGSVVALTAGFQAMREPLGVVASAALVGAVSVAIALIALFGLEETYGQDMDFLES